MGVLLMGDGSKSFIEALFEERNAPYLLVLIIGLSILIRMAFFTGFWGSDDVCYSEVANYILKGTYGISPQLVIFRVGLTYPTALFFYLFGVSEHVAVLFPILASIGCVILAYLIGKSLFNYRVGLLAGLLYAFFPLNVIFSTSLYPEVPMEFFLMLSLLFFLKGSERAGSRSTCMGFLFLCGLSLGLGYLVKESVALMLFVYFGYFIYHLCANKKMRFDYLLIVFGFLLVFLAESLVYYNFTGEFLYRLKASSMVQARLLDFKQEEILLQQFWQYPRSMFLSIWKVGFFYYPLAIAIFYFLIKRSKFTNLLLIWLLGLFLFLQFGSNSPVVYIPFPKQPRYLCLISPPSILLLAIFLASAKRRFYKKVSFCLVAFLFITSLFFVHMSSLLLKSGFQPMRDTYSFLKTQPQKTIYTSCDLVAHLQFLFKYGRDDSILAFNIFDYTKNRNVEFDFCPEGDSYVVVDQIHFKRNPRGILYPEIVARPPSHWQLLKNIDTGLSNIGQRYINFLERLLEPGFVPGFISGKMLATCSKMKEVKTTTIYYVPGGR